MPRRVRALDQPQAGRELPGRDGVDGGALPDAVGQQVDAGHLFVFIGAAPLTGWLPAELTTDDAGFVRTGPDLVVEGQRPLGWELDRDPYLLESSIPGVFVAGDVRSQSVKRVASAVGEGALAVTLVHRYLAE